MEELAVTRFGGDLEPTKEDFADLRQLVEMCEDFYPGIDIWYRRKVLSGLRDKERSAYLIRHNNMPVGAAIFRFGENPKLCTFRVMQGAEKSGFGRILMALIARDLRISGTRFHFTIPDYVWNEFGSFFRDYGMRCVGPLANQYRLFGDEFLGEGYVEPLWQKVRETLPSLLRSVKINGIRSNYDLLMSLHPIYARSIFNGIKKVEVRKKFSTRWKGSTTLVYSTDPVRSFVGFFSIEDVVEGDPEFIWQAYSDRLGCDRDEFFRYSIGAQTVYALIIGDVFEFKSPVAWNQLSQILNKQLVPPQTYSLIRESSALEEAASISTLLQSTL